MIKLSSSVFKAITNTTITTGVNISITIIYHTEILMLTFISGAKVPKLRITGNLGARSSKSYEPLVSSEKINSSTEFVVLASTGIWEVYIMKFTHVPPHKSHHKTDSQVTVYATSSSMFCR